MPEGGSTPRRWVAAVGPVTDVGTWSGIPFHLLQAGIDGGAFDGGLDLLADRPRVKLTRGLWNLLSIFRGRGMGGFQYSEAFLELLWAEAPDLAGSVILNCFSLYPVPLIEDSSIDRWFFVDQTLTQLFDYYEQRGVIGEKVAVSAIEREGAGYRAAAGIIMNSNWARDDVISTYGIDPERVHVVVPGPSLDLHLLASLEPPPARSAISQEEPLRLVFVGKEWERKGLDRLLRAMVVVRARGAHLSLSVMGCARQTLPAELQDISGVEWLGFVDKRANAERFISTLRTADVGCLLSRYEAGGIAMREFHSVGLAVIGPDTGGAPEHMVEGASVAIAPDAPDEAIADVLVELCRDSERLNAMIETSWSNRYLASWGNAIDALGRIDAVWSHRR